MKKDFNFIKWDKEGRQFKVTGKTNDSFLKSFINQDNFTMTTTQDIVNGLFPYIDLKLKEEQVLNSIERETCVKKILQDSISKKTKTIPFVLNECEDKFHQQIAKRIITEFNQIIYKYDVSKIETDFINILEGECPFIGMIPFIFQTKYGDLIVDIRAGQTHFEERTTALCFLYEQLWINNTNSKVIKKIIINPRWEKAVQELENPSKSIAWKLLNFC
ncbi:hypothetical protein [Spiroplasma endosymbiont of Panorpa germanica]|uniref:hypothetical protein n=1 Tax=Spiroplasma endosymbiont of Panorpa germanica TaxID=3066314 RepID=UPI0030D3C22E